MSSTKDTYKVPIVSKQLTKTASVSTKLEWRIEDFRKLIRLYDHGQSISSKTLILPELQVAWQLDVYPRGKNGNYNSYFNLRLIGTQASDGSFSANKTIMADYKIYLLSSTNEENKISGRVCKFEVGTIEGSYAYNKQTIDQLIHPDGSLLVICEVESMAPEKTFSMEPSPNLQLTDHIEKMWKSQLFTDCTLKVGSKSFPAHKCILGQWSKVFRNMFSLPLEESKNGIVEIEDFSADSFPISAMLEYMYTGMVKNEVMEKLASQLLPLADKYDMIPLKETCEVFYASKLTTANVLRMAMFADRYSAAKLKKACANRFAKEGRAALQSKMWKELKSNNKDLANELLELMVEDHPCFADVQKTRAK